MNTVTFKKIILFGFLAGLLIVIEPALAGPGGKIASAIFDTFWCRVIFIVLTIIFLPLIL